MPLSKTDRFIYISSPDLSPIQLPWLPSNRDDDFKTPLRYIRIHLTQIKSMNKDGHLWLQAAHVQNSPPQLECASESLAAMLENGGVIDDTMIDPKVPKGLKPGKVPPSYKAKSLQNLGG